MVKTTRRLVSDGIVASLLITGLDEPVSTSYELGEKTGFEMVTYGFPALVALIGVPFVCMGISAFDKNVATDQYSGLNKLLDKYTFFKK